MSTLKVNTLLAADGNPLTPVAIPGLDKRFATAWVNFNGVGVVAIRSAYNVASITDNGVGDYTVNFSTPLENAKFAAALGGSNISGNISIALKETFNGIRTATQLQVTSSGSAAGDGAYNSVVIFGGQV